MSRDEVSLVPDLDVGQVLMNINKATDHRSIDGVVDAAALTDGFDAVVVRNSGPVLHYRLVDQPLSQRGGH